MPYWVKLKNDSPFCLVIDGERLQKMMNKHSTLDEKTKVRKFDYASYNAEIAAYARKAASQYGEVESIDTLPYAANPVKSDKKGEECYEWTLCYSPNECCGKTSCPKSRACSE